MNFWIITLVMNVCMRQSLFQDHRNNLSTSIG